MTARARVPAGDGRHESGDTLSRASATVVVGLPPAVPDGEPGSGSGVRDPPTRNVKPSPAAGEAGRGDVAAPDGIDTMDEAWNEPFMSRLRNQLTALGEEELEWAWRDLRWYWSHQKNYAESTIDDRLRKLRHMESYEAQPVTFDGTREDLVQSFHLYYMHRKERDADAGAGALENDLKAIKSLGAFLGIPKNVWPSYPNTPPREKPVPAPELVSRMLRTAYTPNPWRTYDNQLARYFLFFTFLIGMRPPSETYEMSVHDVNLDLGTVTITEPKKGDRRRTVYVEPQRLMTGHKNMSVEKWLDHRRKVDPETDQLFPQPSGEPWASERTLRNHVCDLVQDEYPWWHPYMGRTWSVNARLVDWDHDYGRVAQFHGHEKVDRTKNDYEQSARALEKVFDPPGDEPSWIQRALQPVPEDHPITESENDLSSWVADFEDGLSVSPSGGSGPDRI